MRGGGTVRGGGAVRGVGAVTGVGGGTVRLYALESSIFEQVSCINYEITKFSVTLLYSRNCQ